MNRVVIASPPSFQEKWAETIKLSTPFQRLTFSLPNSPSGNKYVQHIFYTYSLVVASWIAQFKEPMQWRKMKIFIFIKDIYRYRPLLQKILLEYK